MTRKEQEGGLGDLLKEKGSDLFQGIKEIIGLDDAAREADDDEQMTESADPTFSPNLSAAHPSTSTPSDRPYVTELGIDLKDIYKKREVPPLIDDVHLIAIATLGKILKDLTKSDIEECECAVIMIINGETSFIWPPPTRESLGGELTRFGMIQMSPQIAVQLSKDYEIPLDPSDPDSMLAISAAYFYDSWQIIKKLMKDEGGINFDTISNRFPAFRPYLNRDMKREEAALLSLIIYHRMGFDPSSPLADKNAYVDILVRLPKVMFRKVWRDTLDTMAERAEDDLKEDDD